MKVLLVNDFCGNVGGAESYFINLCNILVKYGVEVVSLSSSEKHAEVSWKSYQVEPYPLEYKSGLSRLWNPKAAKLTAEIIKKEKPDLMHAHNVFSRLSPSVLNTASRNIPVVLTVHDYRFNCPKSKLNESLEPCPYTVKFGFGCLKRGCVTPQMLLYQTIRNRICEKAFRKTNTLIAPSMFMKKMLEENIGGNVAYIHHGIDVRNFEYTKPPQNKTILFLGRLVLDKGLEYLIKAMPEVNRKLSGVRLVVAGDGPEKEKLTRLAKELNLENVEFLGRIPNENIKTIYPKSDIVCIPSIWQDNSPMVVYEAMASGRPIIASRVGGIPDFIGDGVDGYTLPPKDADALANKIVEVLGDSQLALKLGLNARRKAEREFTIEKHVEKIMDTYNKALNQNPEKTR